MDPGAATSFGVLNLDVGAPYSILIDGIGLSTTNPMALFLGTITDNTAFYDAQVPETTPLGTVVTVQGAMVDPNAPSGLTLTAATTIEVGSPQMPIGATVAGGANLGANSDDGFTQVSFTTFAGGSWPFYGTARTSAFIGPNGYITFGAGDIDHSEAETDMLTGAAHRPCLG